MGDPKGRRTFDREFKESAVRLIVDGGRSVAEVSRSLGIHENQLRLWRQKYLEEREILKKALAIFSKHRK